MMADGKETMTIISPDFAWQMKNEAARRSPAPERPGGDSPGHADVTVTLLIYGNQDDRTSARLSAWPNLHRSGGCPVILAPKGANFQAGRLRSNASVVWQFPWIGGRRSPLWARNCVVESSCMPAS